MAKRNYAEITPEIQHYAQHCGENIIDRELYEQFKVNRGLRDMQGKGVLTGLTEISEVNGTGPAGRAVLSGLPHQRPNQGRAAGSAVRL